MMLVVEWYTHVLHSALADNSLLKVFTRSKMPSSSSWYDLTQHVQV